MKKKLLISFILICVIIAVIGFGMINRDNNTNNGTDFANYPTFTVMASSEHNNLVDVDTTFELAASEDTSLELVQACFSITPKVEYEIVEVRKDFEGFAMEMPTYDEPSFDEPMYDDPGMIMPEPEETIETWVIVVSGIGSFLVSFIITKMITTKIVRKRLEDEI